MINFSVVIPLFNKEDYIYDTIQSVLQQTYSDYEVIVVNDSSTDNSLEVVNSIDSSKIKVYTIPNSGVSEARNYGLAMANYEIIAFLDADDTWSSDYLREMASLIEKYPDANMFFSGYSIPKRDGEIYVNHLFGLPDYGELTDYFKLSYLHGLSINITSATCIRKSISNEIPLFRKGIKRGEDIDLWLRIALRYKIAFCNKSLMTYKEDISSSLSNNYTCSNEEFPYIEWLNFDSKSSYFYKYVVLVIYMFSKSAYLAGDFRACYEYLLKIWNVSFSTKCLKRIFLLVMSFFRK